MNKIIRVPLDRNEFDLLAYYYNHSGTVSSNNVFANVKYVYLDNIPSIPSYREPNKYLVGGTGGTWFCTNFITDQVDFVGNTKYRPYFIFSDDLTGVDVRRPIAVYATATKEIIFGLSAVIASNPRNASYTTLESFVEVPNIFAIKTVD